VGDWGKQWRCHARGGEEERGRERAADTWADRARVAVMGWRVGSTGPAR
jgi:hypothetical protein